MNTKTIIIAEAGVNHNGCIKTAKQLIDIAADSNADYVKFQTFISKLVVTKKAKQADYQTKNIGIKQAQLDLLSKFELSQEDHLILLKHANIRNIKFFSTAFDLSSIAFLKKLNLDFFKIPSGEITNLPYLRLIASYNQPILLSTGMSSISDIDNALNVIEASGTNRKKITLLHCTTEYPVPYADVNLKVINTLRKTFGVNVGYSDHTDSIEVAIAAVALGANVIEKHFTLDKNMSGPDHKASLEPNELKVMIKQIRNVEIALGEGIKRMSSNELKNKDLVRKSLVANGPIKKGQMFIPSNISVKRPGLGISPMHYDDIIGRTANKDYNHDDLIQF